MMTPLKIEQIWQELEAEPAGAAGWVSRLARPEPSCRLLVAVDHGTRTRALLLPTASGTLPPRREWPECRGLELLAMSMAGQPLLALRLRETAASDVFSALAEVLAVRVARASDEGDAVSEMLAGIRQWQAFLTAAREGLSVEAQRGLFGELLFLGRVLVPVLGARAAVLGWKGAARAQQDFQFPRGAVEVKTTSAVVPESVQITSERQLDDRGAGGLFLHVIVVDDRDVAPAPGVPGETLADMVSLTRTLVDGDASARVALDEGLLCAGWLDANAARYDARRLTVRSQLSFHVREGFPRLVEGALPPGVGNVHYGIDLGVCKPFAVGTDRMLELLKGDDALTAPTNSRPGGN